jgi:hypothetical protein
MLYRVMYEVSSFSSEKLVRSSRYLQLNIVQTMRVQIDQYELCIKIP